MGAGLAAPHAAALAGAGGASQRAGARPDYDPSCYLCPGNARAGGARNPAYDSHLRLRQRLRRAHAGYADRSRWTTAGCWSRAASPASAAWSASRRDHNLTVARMAPPELRRVVDAWVEQYARTGRHAADPLRADLREPRRDDGRQQPAPALPDLVRRQPAERSRQGSRPRRPITAREHGGCLLCDYLRIELKERARIVAENDAFRRAGAVLGRLAVRDHGHLQAARGRAWTSSPAPSATGWPTS